MTPKKAQLLPSEPEEFPLAHDAATWDEDTLDSAWDDEEAQQLADEMARFAGD